MTKLKKKTAVAATVALLVCMAVYLNWSYQQGLNAEGQNVSGNEETLVSDADRIEGNINLVNGGEDDGKTDSTSLKLEEYFSQIRLSRKQARDEAIEILQQTSSDEATSAEAKTAAATSISLIASNAIVEARIEGLVISKGYSDCAVFLNDELLSIVVAAPEGGFTSEDAIRIKDIAIGECDIPVENIRIIQAQVE